MRTTNLRYKCFKVSFMSNTALSADERLQDLINDWLSQHPGHMIKHIEHIEDRLRLVVHMYYYPIGETKSDV